MTKRDTADTDALHRYREKRDFSRTPEPEGDEEMPVDTPVFVIHEHDASTHHYDFRLEVDGTLKSWAVPKGPSTDPDDKRLAVPTEDHPLDYAGFEGVIPEDEYGAGTVLIWDRGTYENITTKDGRDVPMADGLNHGYVEFRLDGEKLRGGYSLQRMGRPGEDWLLVKLDDAEADARRNPVSTEPASVASGRSLKEIAAQDGEGGR